MTNVCVRIQTVAVETLRYLDTHLTCVCVRACVYLSHLLDAIGEDVGDNNPLLGRRPQIHLHQDDVVEQHQIAHIRHLKTHARTQAHTHTHTKRLYLRWMDRFRYLLTWLGVNSNILTLILREWIESLKWV